MDSDLYLTTRSVEDTHWWFCALHELILSVARRQRAARASAILDAGCGSGRLLERLQGVGTAEGIDLSSEAVRLCHERGLSQVRRSDLNDTRWHSSHYDLIVCAEVLCHQSIRDETGILRRFHDALTPHGLLVIQLPASMALYREHDRKAQTRRRYTRREVEENLRSAGFSTVWTGYRNSFLFPVMLAKKWWEFVRPSSTPDLRRHSGLVNRVILAMSRLENSFVERRISAPFGASVFAWARRNAD